MQLCIYSIVKVFLFYSLFVWRVSSFRANYQYSNSLTRISCRESDYVTKEDIEKYAQVFGIKVVTSNNGPMFRIDVYAEGAGAIGYLTAFLRPWPQSLIQLDTLQVKNRRQWLGYKRKGWTIEGRGISFILGILALNFGMSKGCTHAELLAVRDDPIMHAILVRLYESMGYKIVREVGDDLASVPDRLLWGAMGTLMRLEIKPAYAIGSREIREFFNKLAQEKPDDNLS